MKRFAVVSALLLGLGLSMLPATPAQARPVDEPMVIQAQTGTNQAVDVKRASTLPKAIVQTHTVNGTPAQSFVFANCDADGWCELKNTNSDMCLTVAGASTARGALVQQAACDSSPAQKWQRVNVATDVYNLKSGIGTNRWLAVRDKTAKNGSRLQVWTHNTSKSQQFRFVAAPNWGVTFAQLDETTKVTTSLTSLSSLAGNWATDLVLTAKLKYGSKTMRTVTLTKKLSAIDAGGSFAWDLKDYGKWTITGEFRKGKTRVKSLVSVKLGITSSDYVIAPLTGTMPVTMLTTSLWGTTVRGADHSIPVIAQFSRAGQWDWNKLPAGVHELPYLSKKDATKRVSGDYLNAHLQPMKDYINDLRALNPDSVFHLYVNDVHARMVHSLLYASKIPAANYTITLLSDGGFSYQKFSSTYASATPAATQAELITKWEQAKDYAYRTGKVSRDMTLSAAQSCIWAAVKSEPSAKWWLTRPSLLTSPGDSNVFAGTVIADSQVVSLSINNQLNAIKAAGAGPLAEFKALYKFKDAYFAKSTASGKKVMMFLGTRLAPAPGELNFPDYAAFTMKYYGTAYDYYYKGHPATPTPFYPEKVAQLKKLKIQDIDSSVPAELILFFNPTIYMSGYPSTTYLSVSDPDMAKGLFGLTKAQGLASTSPSYSIMKWFMAPKSSYSGAIAALPGDFVVEFSDAVVANKGYNIAMWNSAKKSITYYKLVDGAYQKVAA